MALLQTVPDLALQPVLVQTVHKLGSTLRHHVDCNGAMGTALTKTVETAGMEQNQRDVCVGKKTDQNQVLWSGYGTFFPG